MEIALHPLVEQILECTARLTPDYARRQWALKWAVTLGKHVFFSEAVPTGKGPKISHAVR